MLFHFRFADFLVKELPEPGMQSLQLWLKANDLKAYNLGEAHIVDLMHDGKLYRDPEKIKNFRVGQCYDEPFLIITAL